MTFKSFIAIFFRFFPTEKNNKKILEIFLQIIKIAWNLPILGDFLETY